MEEYINNDTLVENEITQLLKSSIICPLCNNILINPLMCMSCQKTYCKKCIDNSSDNNIKCPNNCENPNYQKSIGKNEILSKLKFICVGCKKEIGYDEAQKHHDSCCPDKTSKNMDSNKTPDKPKIRKLQSEEVDKLKKKGKEITYMTGKKIINLLIFILYSNNFRIYWCRKN